MCSTLCRRFAVICTPGAVSTDELIASAEQAYNEVVPASYRTCLVLPSRPESVGMN
jgi:hypothetical protein